MNEKPIDWYSLLTGFGSKSMDEIGLLPFLGVMIVSLFAAFFVSFLYVRFYQARSTGSLIYRAFPLLGMSITAIFIAIQFSLPLSLGLLGALSIVRFRTPIKEPEEIGFIMLVVASSLCCATFNMLFLAIILGCAVIALVCQRFGSRFFTLQQNDGVVIVQLASELFAQKKAEVVAAFEQVLRNGRLESIAENSGETILSYNFQGQKESTLLHLQDVLAAVHDGIKLNIFYNNNRAV